MTSDLRLTIAKGRDADALDQLKMDNITAVLNVTAEWKENPAFRDGGIKFRRIVIKDFVTGWLVDVGVVLS